MPDTNGNGKGQAVPPALPVDLPADEPVREEVKLPPTPAERHQARLEKASKESDDDKSKRRAKEIHLHHVAHMEHVKRVHETFPAPLHRNWDKMTPDEQKNWNSRGEAIAKLNREYHAAVRQTYEDHLAEDRHCKKLRDDAAKKAQEAV